MGVSARARGWAAILLAAYCGLVVAVAFIPRPVDTGVTPWIRGVLATLRRYGLPSSIDIAAVDAITHVALFIPVGMLAVVVLGRRLVWAAMLAGVVAGVATELGQSAILGIGVLERRDIALNTLGSIIGAGVGYVVLVGLDRDRGRDQDRAIVSRRSRRSS